MSRDVWKDKLSIAQQDGNGKKFEIVLRNRCPFINSFSNEIYIFKMSPDEQDIFLKEKDIDSTISSAF